MADSAPTPTPGQPLLGRQVVVGGYHWIGCKAISLLHAAGARLFVCTHPAADAVPDVAAHCQKLGIPFTLDRLTADKLPFRPDVIASVYYRHLIKQDVIDAAGGRIFNLHPSLLPRYRGCSSLTWAMVHMQPQAGYTYHYIDAGCDTGNILLQQALPIEPFDTQQTLYFRVMFEAVQQLLPTVQRVLAGDPGTPQQGEPSHYKRGAPHGGAIDPSWTDAQVEHFIRAMTFPPYPYATLDGVPVRTLQDYRALRGTSA